MINPAAFTHTSVAILDALNAFDGNDVTAGLGTQEYRPALRRLAHLLDKAGAK